MALEILSEFVLKTIQSGQFNFLFRFIIARLDGLETDEALYFLEYVQTKITEAQPQLKQTVLRTRRQYIALLRIQRLEKAKSVVPLELKQEYANAVAAGNKAVME